MTDEERQRQMDFILNTLAKLTARFDQADLERKADAVRIARVEESFSTVTKLLVRYDERFDETEARLGRVEDAVVTLTKILEGRG